MRIHFDSMRNKHKVEEPEARDPDFDTMKMRSGSFLWISARLATHIDLNDEGFGI